VLALLFVGGACVFAGEVLSTLFQPLFQDRAMWLLVSFALGITLLLASWPSVLAPWSRECRRLTLRYALKKL